MNQERMKQHLKDVELKKQERMKRSLEYSSRTQERMRKILSERENKINTMTKQEIKQYILGLNETEKLDLYNSIACRFGSADDIIFIHDSKFYETQFLNSLDAEQSKADNTINESDKYVKMIEYKKLETSNDILELMEVEILIDLIFENLDEVVEMGLIQNKAI
ncbi:hypothetical protein OBK23_13015 [Empedobacter falsenii]|uniref:hypothetical protein n=1 Tax=Empedobacter falsenii TaxID=343874 RepID=UPI003A80B2F8